jgi:hypothetical protein
MDDEVKNARAKLAERFGTAKTQIGGKGKSAALILTMLYRYSEKNEEACQHSKC